MAIIIAFIAMTIPVLGFGLTLVYFNQYRRVLISALLCGLSFSAAFYGYIPDEGNDIFRHIASMELYADVSLWDAFNLLKNDASHISSVYTWDLWLWIMSKFDNPLLLQSSGAFMGYSLISYFAFDFAKIHKWQFQHWLLVLFVALVLISPLDIVIGIRNANAFLICALALYQYYFKKKSSILAFSLLLVALFLHHSVIVILGVWFIMPFVARFKWISVGFTILFLFLFRNYENYLYLVTGGSSGPGGLVANTLYSASAYQNDLFNTSIHAIVSLLWWIVVSAFLLWHSKQTLKYIGTAQQSTDFMKNKRLYNMALFIFVISVAMLPILGNNASRLFIMANILSLFIMMQNPNEFILTTKHKVRLYPLLLYLAASGNILLYFYNMNWGTASLKSFFLSSLLGYFTNFITNIM